MYDSEVKIRAPTAQTGAREQPAGSFEGAHIPLPKAGPLGQRSSSVEFDLSHSLPHHYVLSFHICLYSLKRIASFLFLNHHLSGILWKVFFCDLLLFALHYICKIHQCWFLSQQLFTFTNIWGFSVGLATIDLFSGQWALELLQTVLLWKLVLVSWCTRASFSSVHGTSHGILGHKVCVFLPLLDNGSGF